MSGTSISRVWGRPKVILNSLGFKTCISPGLGLAKAYFKQFGVQNEHFPRFCLKMAPERVPPTPGQKSQFSDINLFFRGWFWRTNYFPEVWGPEGVFLEFGGAERLF